ncbi:hypothetical protein WM08_00730 [Burkholderia ubonensis]|nr:hypothetical protein WJ98_31430 [Burkholderia ubonensis]KWB52846.1 hypothetical protein WL35_02200 [Burkholderia ubonensis]KWI87686.1 hypothetical protein WM08_00730 [Burkholderia ubonensis]KWI96712.1 hypothetical protein WM09_28255 [Burkholderia ubonensis]
MSSLPPATRHSLVDSANLNLLISLDALLEEGSVAGAARRMNLSPPAMSRTLARIRETVGDPIFVQGGRKMVPTPRALDRQFSVRATDVFVGVYSSQLLEEMARAMVRFMPEADDVDDDALRSGRIDLFISASRRLGQEIRVRPLFTTKFVGLARSGHSIFDDDITPERFAH